MSIYDREWYWQDRARRERQYYNPREFRSQGAGAATYGSALPRHFSALSINIALAAVVVLVWLSMELVMQWRAETATRELLRAGQEAARRAQAQAVQMQREAVERQARRDAELQRQERQRLQAIAQRQHLENDRRRAAVAETDRKERAWAKFYRKPAICNDAATIECANAYIRPKRSFEEKYARGEL
jgi:hypothetical protein